MAQSRPYARRAQGDPENGSDRTHSLDAPEDWASERSDQTQGDDPRNSDMAEPARPERVRRRDGHRNFVFRDFASI